MKTQTKSDEINCKLVGKQWHLLKCEYSIECKRCTCAIHQFTSIPFQGNAVGTTMASKFYLPGIQQTSLACSSQYIIIGEWSVRTNTGVFVLKFRQLFFKYQHFLLTLFSHDYYELWLYSFICIQNSKLWKLHVDVTHVFFILRLIYWNSYSMFSFCSCHVQCSGSFMHESLLVVLVQRERESIGMHLQLAVH